MNEELILPSQFSILWCINWVWFRLNKMRIAEEAETPHYTISVKNETHTFTYRNVENSKSNLEGEESTILMRASTRQWFSAEGGRKAKKKNMRNKSKNLLSAKY